MEVLKVSSRCGLISLSLQMRWTVLLLHPGFARHEQHTLAIATRAWRRPSGSFNDRQRWAPLEVPLCDLFQVHPLVPHYSVAVEAL